MGANLELVRLIQLLYTSQFKQHTVTVDTSYWIMERTFNGSNTECDMFVNACICVSVLMSREMLR